MASALMAWVWFCVTLAQLNNVGGQQDVRGPSSGRDRLRDGPEKPSDKAPEEWIHRTPAPVWRFLQGKHLLLASIT